MYTCSSKLRTDVGNFVIMSGRKPLTGDDGEVRELTAEDFARAAPFSALPEGLKSLLSSPDWIVVPDATPKQSDA